MNRHHLIYLASPISIPDETVFRYRIRMAARFAANLIRCGQAVYCPAAYSAGILAHTTKRGLAGWREWRRTDLAILARCDILLVLALPGWRESKGVRAEIRAARKFGIPWKIVTIRGETT